MPYVLVQAMVNFDQFRQVDLTPPGVFAGVNRIAHPALGTLRFSAGNGETGLWHRMW
jgi:hypothetical protein